VAEINRKLNHTEKKKISIVFLKYAKGNKTSAEVNYEFYETPCLILGSRPITSVGDDIFLLYWPSPWQDAFVTYFSRMMAAKFLARNICSDTALQIAICISPPPHPHHTRPLYKNPRQSKTANQSRSRSTARAGGAGAGSGGARERAVVGAEPVAGAGAEAGARAET
jgi:hypothetical protein